MLGVWHFGLDLYMVTNSLCSKFLAFYLDWECNEHSCPLTPDLRLSKDARGLIQLRNDVP